jgi:hypothetical protein
MDSAVTPATAITGKKQAKPKKASKDLTEEEGRVESGKRIGQREVARARKATAKLEEEPVPRLILDGFQKGNK